MEFLVTIFPNKNQEYLEQLLKEHCLEDAITLALNDEEQLSDIDFLQSLFPKEDEQHLWNTLIEFGLNDAIERLLQIENNKFSGKVILPKYLTDCFMTTQNQDHLNTLYEMFPMFEQDQILAVLCKTKGDVEKCVLILTEFANHVDPRAKESENVYILMEWFPNVPKYRLIQVARMFRSVEECADFLYKDPVENRWSCIPDSVVSSASNLSIKYTFSSSALGNEPELKTDKPDVTTTQGTPTELRMKASEYLLRRNMYFKEAAKRYSEKNLTGRGSALYYSELGHQMNDLMKKTNIIAADLIFQENRKKHPGGVIDLHGLTVAEAKERLLPELISNNQATVKVITGYGHHSEGDGKLLKSMQSFLSKDGWKVEEGGNGWFFVKTKR